MTSILIQYMTTFENLQLLNINWCGFVVVSTAGNPSILGSFSSVHPFLQPSLPGVIHTALEGGGYSAPQAVIISCLFIGAPLVPIASSYEHKE